MWTLTSRRHLDGLEQHRDALSPANAGRTDGACGVAASDLVGEVGNDARAAGTNGVAQRDGAAVHVGAATIEVESLLYGEVLRRKRFIHL